MKTNLPIYQFKEILSEINNHLQLIENKEKISTIDKDIILQKIRNLYEVGIALENEAKEIVQPIVESKEEIIDNIMDESVEEQVKESAEIVIEETPPAIIAEKKVVEEISENQPAREVEAGLPPKEEIVYEKPIIQEIKEEVKASQEEKFSSRLESDLFSEIDDKSINQKLGSSQADQSIGKKMQQKKIDDLKVAIGINDKFLMMNELFGGRLDAYTDAIKLLNDKDNYDDARGIFMDLAEQYGWETDNRAAEILMNFIERRYL